MEIFILVLLILLNGLFSMSEVAVISARKSNLKYDALKGNKFAQAALELTRNIDQFLSTVQVGITLIGIVTGLFSGDVLASKFVPVLEWVGLSSKYSYSVAQILIVTLVTYLTILFGELIPKRIGMSSSEKIAKVIAKPMKWISRVTYPFVWILSRSTSLLYSLLNLPDRQTKITEDEIKSIIEEGKEGGEVLQVEQDIVERVFTLGDREMESIMTPRNKVVSLDTSISRDDIKRLIKDNPFSKYPVVDGSSENMVGVVYLRDLFISLDENTFSFDEIIKEPHYFYENMNVYPALDRMKRERISMAFITDDLGLVTGVVTMKDIMEGLVGELPVLNELSEIVERADGGYLVDGQCSFYVFLEYFNMGVLFAEYEYNTLGGLILDQLKRIPIEGEVLYWLNFKLEVIDMDGVRIDKVLVTLIAGEL